MPPGAKDVRRAVGGSFKSGAARRGRVLLGFSTATPAHDGFASRADLIYAPCAGAVRRSANQHAEVTIERPHPPGRLRKVEIPAPLTIQVAQARRGKKGFEVLLHGHRA